MKPTQCELLKVLKVLKETTVQVVEDKEVPVDFEIARVDGHDVKIFDVKAAVFEGKVAVEGTADAKVVVVDPGHFLRQIACRIPFKVHLDIPGLGTDEEVEVQTHLVRFEAEDDTSDPKCFVLKCLLVLQVKVSKWVQRFVMTTTSPECVANPRAFFCL